MSTEPTGPWVEPMKRAKAVDPRNGLPSWNRLAELAGVSTTTITGMISGARKTSAKTIQSVAEVLRVEPEDVSAWLALTRPVRKPYAAPPEASLLTDRQQAALTAFIRALVAEEQEEGIDRGTSAEKRPSDGDDGEAGLRLVEPPKDDDGGGAATEPLPDIGPSDHHEVQRVQGEAARGGKPPSRERNKQWDDEIHESQDPDDHPKS